MIPTATINVPETEKPWLKKQRPWRRRDGVFRFAIDQFYQLDELSYFEDRKVELIDGIVFEMTQNPEHTSFGELQW